MSNKTHTFQVRISAQLLKMAKRRAEKEEQPLSQVIRMLLRQYIVNGAKRP